MKKIMLFSPLFVLLCTTSLMSAPSAVKGAARKDRSNLPITINSNQLTADNKGKTAIFTGKVVAKQGDVTILADKLTIYYGDKGDKKNEVEKVEADGNVRILQGNRVGIASHAVYESKAGRITLTGKPRVMQGNDTTSGKIITYLIDDEQSTVTGDVGERVITTIHPQDGKAHESSR